MGPFIKFPGFGNSAVGQIQYWSLQNAGAPNMDPNGPYCKDTHKKDHQFIETAI